MSFWNDVTVNVHAATRSAEVKVGRSAEITRLKMEITAINQLLNKKYELLGRRAYREYRRGNTENDRLIQVLTDEISALRATRRKAEERIEQVKHVQICAECSAENPCTAEYCTKCGEQLD